MIKFLIAFVALSISTYAQIPLPTDMIVTLSPSQIIQAQKHINPTFIDNPISLSDYTAQELSLQTKINNVLPNLVFTLAAPNLKQKWNTIDSLDITPYTWQWIDFEMMEDGNHTKMSLRRPNTWIRERKAFPGNRIHFDWKEVGVSGWATVVALRPNQLDTRLLEHDLNEARVALPIIGKFEHTSNEVYDLYFESSKPMGVTKTHPIWSLDRNDWIAAIDLKLGERVQTPHGERMLVNREKKSGTHKVYNIEVYRSHNYFVTEDMILVHNGPICIGTRTVADVVKRKSITVKGKVYKIKLAVREVRAPHVEYYGGKINDGNWTWNKMIDNRTGQHSKIEISLYDDGTAVITEGRTRFVAAEIAERPVDITNDNAVDIRNMGNAKHMSFDLDQAVWDRSKRAENQLMLERMNNDDF